MNILHTKKFRHGSVSLSLTIAIIAIVILVNAIFTALADKYLWFIDMTAEQIYTLALLSQRQLTPDEMKKFISSTLNIIEKTL